MKVQFSARSFAITCALIVMTQAANAQTSTQVFSAVDVRTSETSAAYATPDTFNTSTLNLTCPASGISAVLSGPLMNTGGTAPQLTASNALQPGGNLLVDNNLLVTVNSGTPTDVCTGFNQGSPYNGLPVPPNLQENCFQLPYASAIDYPAFPSPLDGDDPDTTLAYGGTQTVDAVGGVAPVDISSMLVPGPQSESLTIAEEDDGGDLTASTIFLTTNCTVNGVTGPATISGNTITPGNSPTLTQTASFDTTTGQQVGFVYDVSGVSVFSANANGAIPQFSDSPLDPTLFQPDFVPGTSFATSSCLVHTGELLPPANTPACKLYTLECFTETNNVATGAQCPVSVVDDEIIKDIFDGPAFSLQNIYTTLFGPTYHEGIGLLMASDTWSPSDGGPCVFDPASGLETLPCPQNLLTSFSGPGAFGGIGQTTNPNSTFVSVYGVPEDLTSVFVAGEWPDNWVNTSTPKVYFQTLSPNFTHGAYVQSGNKLVPLPGVANYIPAPIQSLTYGISPVGSVPSPVNVPISTDTTLTTTANCSAIPFTAKTVPNFTPPVQTLPSMPDGQYLLHYYAEDCAGTRELLFTEAPNTGSWSTNFYTYPINIDTTPPVVSGLTLTTSAPYKVGSTVDATYSCTDATTGSGVVFCGTNFYGPQTTYNTGTLKAKVYTGSAGNQSFTVYAIDGAGNMSSKTINYTVTR